MTLTAADRFAPEPGGEAAHRLALRHLAARQTCAGGKPVAPDVGNQFRPALAPHISGYLGAVRVADQTADFLRARGAAAVCFAGATYGVCVAALAGARVYVAGLAQR